MQYEMFRNVVLALLKEDKEWSVSAEWKEAPTDQAKVNESAVGAARLADIADPGSTTGAAGNDWSEDFIELEQEKGPFYEFMTISMNLLYYSYMEDGWDAVRRDLEKYTRREGRGVRRARGIDYEARLNEKGVQLYGKLRTLRAKIAAGRQLPPYFIFMNRSLYEMCCRQPATIEELRGIYGVGEKNSGEYGEMFLEEIQAFTEGKKLELARMPGK